MPRDMTHLCGANCDGRIPELGTCPKCGREWASTNVRSKVRVEFVIGNYIVVSAVVDIHSAGSRVREGAEAVATLAMPKFVELLQKLIVEGDDAAHSMVLRVMREDAEDGA